MNAKQIANAIRAEIKALETRCESLKKIAVELETENGGVNPLGGNPMSEKTCKKILARFKKEEKANA
jgi:hypothetical protein